MIGTGTLVPPGKVLESGYLYLGNPVRQIRPLADTQRAFFRYTSKPNVGLAAQYLAEANGS